MDDPFDGVIDLYEWVAPPPLEILDVINANLDADAGLNEECD